MLMGERAGGRSDGLDSGTVRIAVVKVTGNFNCHDITARQHIDDGKCFNNG
jgi:hypothetical protein